MPQFRKHVRITINGETHDIVTNAHDAADTPLDNVLFRDVARQMYNACVRLHVPGVPRTFDAFMEALDGFDPDEAGAAPEDDEVGPTLSRVSAG